MQLPVMFAASFSRMRPSRLRVSPRSHASVCDPDGGQKQVSTSTAPYGRRMNFEDAGRSRWRLRRSHPRSIRDQSLFVRRRKPKDEKRLFICQPRLRNPHAPRFSAPKIFRGAVAQYLSGRTYRLITGSLEVREFHSYVVDVGEIIVNMEIESGHDSAPISAGGSTGLSLPPTPGGFTCR
jgi:hypothetical protein